MSWAAYRPHPAHLALAIGLVAAAVCAALLGGPLMALSASSQGEYDPERMVLLYATLPRLVMAMLCGAALSIAGAILQQVLRNPLASPTTLGVDAGARLAIALAAVFFPAVLGIGRDLIAFAGSAVALARVFTLARGRAFSAINLILAGLVISLYCGSLAVIITLAKDRYLVGLFVWGSGSLSQQGWQPSIDLAIRVALSLLPLIWLWRPLDLLELGDETSQGLGVSVVRIRAIAIGTAVLVSAFVTSAVGVIGFIGLCAPLLARLSGANRFGARLIWSAIIGALMLLLTDASLQLWTSPASAFLPTGAVTAVLGSPLLLLLLPKLKFLTPPPMLVSRAPKRKSVPKALVAAGLVAFAVFALCTLLIGRGADGSWTLLAPADFETVMPWRAPRFAAACAAGAMLAMAGMILQRLTGNPMASPEILGVSAGSILAVIIALFLFNSLGTSFQFVTATLGGVAVIVLILALSRRSGFSPERVLLAGIALNALIDAVVGVLSATGDPNAVMLLSWLGGSTSGTSSGEAMYAMIAAIVLTVPVLLTTRWLTLLPLGAPQATALGVPTPRARIVLFGIAALLTAAATPIVGPLTFVGLMAPHIVTALGIRGTLPTILASFVAGAGMIAIADFLSRSVAFPILLPTGITAALVAGPFLLVLLRRRMGTA